MSSQSKATDMSPWGKAAAGATGAVLANALVQVKEDEESASVEESTRSEDPHYASTMDAITRIMNDEGVKGLYAGIGGSLIGVASTNFAYFYWYSVVRNVYVKSHRSSQHPSTVVELSLGAIAGAIAQLCTIPVAVITTRQQTQGKGDRKNMTETALEVIRGPDGVFGLWRGLKASLVLVVNPAITYGAYERCKSVLFPGKENLRAWEAFLLGAMSKALATIMTQPLIVAKVGLQSKPPRSRNGQPFTSFIEVMKFIISKEGYFGLFKGIGPQILKGLLVQGILMTTKERMELMFILMLRYLRRVKTGSVSTIAKSA
ncbi:Peroxisomal adenine nucleotide transporter 1 [Ceratocystis fimbriata CBS 114723]|uniref:Peroxisomal adenine nucleotide transporter 1 n=1 Tax=Ceratocystis fimbriata CBS 114723 TaxID=1035309 RepID=A0A2C5WYJ1_9PEZI|nr:Peroxisomal adenine nucleotide transporter 1 [Ceratocystis fimbriata CBS 114723]